MTLFKRFYKAKPGFEYIATCFIDKPAFVNTLPKEKNKYKMKPKYLRFYLAHLQNIILKN